MRRVRGLVVGVFDGLVGVARKAWESDGAPVVMGVLTAASLTAAVALAVSGCGSDPESRDEGPGLATEEVVVTVGDGREITCLVVVVGGTSGVSCDWPEAVLE